MEAVLVAAVGLVFALAANDVSPRGLSLTRNYFPVSLHPVVHGPVPAPAAPANAVPEQMAGTNPGVFTSNQPSPTVPATPTNPAVATTPAPVSPAPTNGTAAPIAAPPGSVVAEIQSAGFQVATSNLVMAWFGDPGRPAGKIVFVDARNEEEFGKGHIPGAHLFDPYHPDKYFAAVMPPCQTAETVVVYCHGGDCDDSLTAASLLRDVGIPAGKIYVYAGGMAEWEAGRYPLEKSP